MNKTIALTTRIILILAFIISIVCQAGLMFMSDVDGITMNFIIATEIFFAVAIVVALLVFPIVSIVESPKSIFKPLIAIVGVAILCVVAYMFSGSTMTDFQLNKYQITVQTERLVETGLILTYIIFAGAVGSLVVTSVKNMISK